LFQTEQPKISAYARRSPENLARVVGFVLSTIQAPIERSPDDVADIDARGLESRVLWGSKRSGLTYTYKHACDIYNACEQAYALGDDHGLLYALLAIPGIGLPKAGFIAQLAYGRVGCLDTHNLSRFDLEAKDFATSGLHRDGEALSNRIARYLATCRRFGGCEQLWNTWCDYVAQRRPRTFPGGADAVSRLHTQALGL
jgi:hypothetical protein